MRWCRLRAFLYVAIFPSLHVLCFHQSPQHNRRICEDTKFALKGRASKEDLSTILTSVGLQSAVSKKTTTAASANGSSKKSRKQPKQVAKARPQQQPNSSPATVLLKNQLDYARNGSAALRALLDPQRLQTVRADLLAYSETKELEAWRQKVEVGSMDPARANSCHTIQDCKKELEKLQISLDSLPFLQYFNTWRDLASVKDLSYSLGQAASVLLDVPSVRLYQDALFTKRAGDGPTPWHVDARMAPFDTSHMITFWIPLQDVPANSGTALLFVPKSHNDFALPFWNDFEDGQEYSRLEERYNQEQTHYMPLNLGDATVHSGWTLHCADGNNSQEHRHALAVTFVDAQAEVRETALDFSPDTSGAGYGDNEDQWSYREWVQQVPKRKKFGNHELVPIVWPRKKKKP